MMPQENMDDGGMTPDQMADDLRQLMDAVTERHNTFHGQAKTVETEMAKSQNKAIADLFQVLEKNGVDPSDPAAVTAFLDQLKQENPEGYAMFEAAINNLLQQKGALGQQQVPDGIAEPLNTEEQMGVQPGGAAPIDMNLPMNQVSKIPLGEVTDQAQPVDRQPAPPDPLQGLPG